MAQVVPPENTTGVYTFTSTLPDIGHLGKWSVSSFKFGFGSDCLRDDDIDTYWHSDGPQPHTITVQFPRKIAVQKVALLLAFELDDSYTPTHLAIRAGTGAGDTHDVRNMQFEKPNGWIEIDMSTEPTEDLEGPKPLHVHLVQVTILTNHMNGKDTHIRGMKVLGPKDEGGENGDPFPFLSSKFTTFQTIR